MVEWITIVSILKCQTCPWIIFWFSPQVGLHRSNLHICLDNIFKVSLQTDFVNRFVGCHLLLIYSTLIMFVWTFSLKTWQSTSMYFVISRKIRSLQICMVDLLSLYSFMGGAVLKPRDCNNYFNRISSHATIAIDLYYASTIDHATTDCFLLFQLTRLPPMMQQYPLIDFLSLTFPAQFAS